jgi:hypothetical protein
MKSSWVYTHIYITSGLNNQNLVVNQLEENENYKQMRNCQNKIN